MALVTDRLSLPYPEGTDAADVPFDMEAAMNSLDARTVIFGSGVLSARPVQTVGSPGVPGTFYYASDNGHLYFGYGTGWLDLGPVTIAGLGEDSITAFELAPNSVTAIELANNSVDSAAIIDGSVDTPEIANALKPSISAGAGTEALRALGLAAGRAAAGTHAGQHNIGGGDQLDWAGGVAANSPSKRLGSTPLTAPVPFSSVSVTAPTVIAASPAIALDGSTKITVEFLCSGVEIVSGGSTTVALSLWDSVNGGTGVMLGILDIRSMQFGFYTGFEKKHEFPSAPAAGSHVFWVAAHFVAASSGSPSGNFLMGSGGVAANSWLPGAIIVSKT